MIRLRFLFVLLIILHVCSCKKAQPILSVEIHLNDRWFFRKAGDVQWLPAKVPGDVLSDLLANEKIDDPFFSDNEKRVQWVEKEDWEYQTTFDAPLDVIRNDKVFLHFAGLDTYADIYLNGSLVHKADNMFRSWDIPCKDKLKERGNTLRIYFHSAVNTGLAKMKQLSYALPSSNEQAPENERTSVYTRKAPFQYGWDWGPRLVNCGIWRPITLCGWSKAHINDVYLMPRSVSVENADYKVMLNIEATKAGKYELNFLVDEKPVGASYTIDLRAGENHKEFDFQVEKPDLWWCNGMGNHYLYTLKIQLSQEGKEIADKTQKFGIRKLELVQDSDAIGRTFYVKINGVPVFMKGANYIPPDIILSRLTPERYETLINNAVTANMNMLRVWGGAIYENDAFYDICDKNGILVWQDFMFACAMQPGDSAHIENIRQEAVQNVTRLRNHPCIALWCGNNENLVAWDKWNWKKKYTKEVTEKISSDYKNLFHVVLPRVIQENDPKSAYWSSSPSAFGNNLPDKKSGDEHEWRIWFETAPFSAYAEKPGRFVSEYGMQSFPAMKTIRSFANDSNLEPRSPILDFHQRCNMAWISPLMNGTQMISNYLEMYYNDPTDFESFVYLSQVSQAEALKTAIEAHRINRQRCMGSLYWQINDCWPTISWSTIDYYGRWKPSHFAVKRAFANVLVASLTNGGKLDIFAVNDSLASLDAELRLTVMDFTGKQLWNQSDSVKIQPNASQLIWNGREEQICPRQLSFRAFMLIQLVVKGKLVAENMLYFTDPKYLDLPMPDISYQVKGTFHHYELVLITDKFAKNVVLETTDKDATFSNNNFDLLPGRELKLSVSYLGTREEFLNDLKINSLVNSY